MRCFEKFKECKGKFHSLLTGKKVTDKRYEDVLNIWNRFEMKNMKGYYDL